MAGPNRADELGFEILQDLHHLESGLAHIGQASGPLRAFAGLSDQKQLMMDLVVGREHFTALSAGGLTLGLVVLFELSLIEQSGGLHGHGVAQRCLSGETPLAAWLGALHRGFPERFFLSLLVMVFRLRIGRKPRR